MTIQQCMQPNKTNCEHVCAQQYVTWRYKSRHRLKGVETLTRPQKQRQEAMELLISMIIQLIEVHPFLSQFRVLRPFLSQIYR